MKSKPHNQNRRDFLVRGAVTVGAAASLAIIARSNAAPVESEPTSNTPVDTKHESGYRLTPHIQEYYRKARF